MMKVSGSGKVYICQTRLLLKKGLIYKRKKREKKLTRRKKEQEHIDKDMHEERKSFSVAFTFVFLFLFFDFYFFLFYFIFFCLQRTKKARHRILALSHAFSCIPLYFSVLWCAILWMCVPTSYIHVTDRSAGPHAHSGTYRCTTIHRDTFQRTRVHYGVCLAEPPRLTVAAINMAAIKRKKK